MIIYIYIFYSSCTEVISQKFWKEEASMASSTFDPPKISCTFSKGKNDKHIGYTFLCRLASPRVPRDVSSGHATRAAHVLLTATAAAAAAVYVYIYTEAMFTLLENVTFVFLALGDTAGLSGLGSGGVGGSWGGCRRELPVL